MSKVRNCAARTALDSSPPLFVEDHKVVVRFRRSFGALIFALAAMLAAAQPDPATAEDRGAIPLQARSGCIVGHRFEPGPIVAGHNRQPTIREFQWRMRELLELEQRDAYNCVGSPVSSDARRRLMRIVRSVSRDWKARSLVAGARTIGINVQRTARQLATRSHQLPAMPLLADNDDRGSKIDLEIVE